MQLYRFDFPNLKKKKKKGSRGELELIWSNLVRESCFGKYQAISIATDLTDVKESFMTNLSRQILIALLF